MEASIEDLPGLGLGLFDYIVSSGVLHHLASPETGRAALREVLKPDGGLGIMVYGRHGRTAIYHLQETLRLIAPPELGAEQRLRIVKRLLRQLRPEHPATLYGDAWQREIDEHGDAGLYDMFLHSQDRPYTVPEIYEWLDDAGLRLLNFDFPVGYDPRTWNDRLDCDTLSDAQRHAPGGAAARPHGESYVLRDPRRLRRAAPAGPRRRERRAGLAVLGRHRRPRAGAGKAGTRWPSPPASIGWR